ncbi:MAG: beta-lactamase domain protein [Acidimicrobiaceae bacterium]|nr:beta-lactamase domain protein [Acidimicrobiaceae bacterium]
MTVDSSPAAPGEDRVYCRQLLAGRDFARGDEFAGQMANFVYALGDRSTGQALLVDPAYAPRELVDLLAADDMRLVGAVLTHYHADHAGGAIFGHAIAGITSLLEEVDVPVHVQRDEVEWVIETTGLTPSSLTSHGAGDVVEVGAVAITLLHTPGHTPGSQCVLVGRRLVTGDTLFIDGCGRTDLPGGDGLALYDSIVNTIGSLPDTTAVLPGHDYSRVASAELGTLRSTNPVLVPRAAASWIAAFTS